MRTDDNDLRKIWKKVEAAVKSPRPVRTNGRVAGGHGLSDLTEVFIKTQLV
jgi:hypothetical protein